MIGIRLTLSTDDYRNARCRIALVPSLNCAILDNPDEVTRTGANGWIGITAQSKVRPGVGTFLAYSNKFRTLAFR